VVAAGLAAVLLWGETVHWRASRRRLGVQTVRGSREVVVVLGYKNRGEQANLINRHRLRMGLRSQNLERASRLVLSGGSVGGRVPEAELLARYARDVLGYGGELITETQSRTTWENIRNVIPLIEDADQIKIVSNELHAERGRAYLWRLRPDLAERLVRSEEYRFGELMLLKPVMALIGSKNLRCQST